MCRALQSALDLYSKSSHAEKVLFILSDGKADDGDPELLCSQLKDCSVTIFCCFLSEKTIMNSRKLYDKPDKSWDEAHIKMFNMSSIIPNTSTALSILVDNGWELPESGECRLFAQVNHPEAIQEFARVVNLVSE